MGFHTKPTTFVSHVTIKVEDLKRSIEFYKSVIGFDILEQTTSSAKLTTDGKTSILSLEQPGTVNPMQGKTTGLYHFALLLPERSDLANIVIHFRENGIRFAASDHLVSEALYLRDPDRNGIEIYADRDPSQWNWVGHDVEMTTIPLNIENLLASQIAGKSWNGMPKGTVMGHIHLHVAELEMTEEFYVNGLGFDVVNRYGGQALFFSNGKYHHHVAVNVWNGIGVPRPQENSVGLKSFALTFPNEEVRQKVIGTLQNVGATITEENNKFITHDPSGNTIELTV